MTDRTAQLHSHKHQDEVLCVLWAMHFPPNFPGYPDHSRLLDEKAVIDEANRTNVRAILAGHTHQQLTYRNPGMTFWVFCCGTSTQYEPLAVTKLDHHHGNFFQVITIVANQAGQTIVSGKDYIYGDSGTGSKPRLMRWMEFPLKP